MPVTHQGIEATPQRDSPIPDRPKYTEQSMAEACASRVGERQPVTVRVGQPTRGTYRTPTSPRQQPPGHADDA